MERVRLSQGLHLGCGLVPEGKVNNWNVVPRLGGIVRWLLESIVKAGLKQVNLRFRSCGYMNHEKLYKFHELPLAKVNYIIY